MVYPSEPGSSRPLPENDQHTFECQMERVLVEIRSTSYPIQLSGYRLCTSISNCRTPFTYRHVILPKELAKTLPKTRLLSENEWRSIGVQQSRGWQHYAIHRPEPHILLFRRPLGTDPQTGAVDPELKRMALEEYKGQFGLKGN